MRPRAPYPGEAPPWPPVDPRLASRGQALVQTFDAIARDRMAGLPLLNPALGVELVGLAPVPAPLPMPSPAHSPADAAATAAARPDAAVGAPLLGVLITPWFMNLVLLPLQRLPGREGVGRTQSVALPGQTLDFIGGWEPALGAFEACSLFSPMFEFADMAAARATAEAVLSLVRGAGMPAAAQGDEIADTVWGTDAAPADRADAVRGPARPVAVTTTAASMPGEVPAPARRGFLFGRRHGGTGT